MPTFLAWLSTCTEVLCPAKPKIFTLCLFTESFPTPDPDQEGDIDLPCLYQALFHFVE